MRHANLLPNAFTTAAKPPEILRHHPRHKAAQHGLVFVIGAPTGTPQFSQMDFALRANFGMPAQAGKMGGEMMLCNRTPCEFVDGMPFYIPVIMPALCRGWPYSRTRAK